MLIIIKFISQVKKINTQLVNECFRVVLLWLCFLATLFSSGQTTNAPGGEAPYFDFLWGGSREPRPEFNSRTSEKKDFSARWAWWNKLTIVSGVGLLLCSHFMIITAGQRVRGSRCLFSEAAPSPSVVFFVVIVVGFGSKAKWLVVGGRGQAVFLK